MLILVFATLLILLPLALRLRGKGLPVLFLSVAILFVSLVAVVAIWDRIDPQGVVRAIIPGLPKDPVINNTFYTTDYLLGPGLTMTALWIAGAGLVWLQARHRALYFPRLQELAFWGLTICFTELFLSTCVMNIGTSLMGSDMDEIEHSIWLLKAANTANTLTAPVLLLSALLLLGLLFHAAWRRLARGPIEY